MQRYIATRLLYALGALLAVTTIAFFLMRVAPGGPFNLERPLDPRVMENLRSHYHLDEPLWRQYLRYLAGLAHGDLGPSFTWRDYSVGALLAHAFPISAGLGAAALCLATLAGIAAGAFAAFRRRGAADKTVLIIATLIVGLPSFVIAPVLQLIFGLRLHWLPIGGWEDGGVLRLILPIVTLATPQAAVIARLTRASMIEALESQSVRTLRAYGMPASIVFRRALRAALAPIVSYLGPAAAALMTGSVAVETIFGIPGIGRSFVEGALNRDYTLVMGATILVAGLVIVFNFLVDIAYAAIDPRVRHD
ncbi:MAG TPA: ABC transporter permease subunit [Roseiarcus sp.]|nr:ABC transporter permease subunit [Roseiarcus sp.]